MCSLGWKKDLGNDPLPEKTWAALRQVPYIFGGVGIGMFGLHWIIGRRQKLAGGSHPETPSQQETGEARGPDGEQNVTPGDSDDTE